MSPDEIVARAATAASGIPDDCAARRWTPQSQRSRVPPAGSSARRSLTGTASRNAVIAKLGTNGTICLYTQAGTHLIADITGYVAG